MVITEEDNVIRISKKEHRIIQLIAEGKTSPEIAKELCLTEREEEILPLIAAGLTSPQIAERVCLSLPTIKWYRKKLKEKLNVESTAMLIRFAIQQGLI